MTDDPSFDRLVGESLARHGRGVDERRGDLADVLARVDRRRTRRRGAAAIGSVLAVGLGAAGIVLVGGPAGDPAAGDGDPDATDVVDVWGCAGLISWDGTADYYASCEPLPGGALPSAPAVVPPATTVVDGQVAGPSASTIAAFPSTPEPTTTVTWPAPATTIVDGQVAGTLASTIAAFPSAPEPTTTVTRPAPETAPTTTGGSVTSRYRVTDGDSVEGIADRAGVAPEVLAEINGWPDGVMHPLRIGEVIDVPVPGVPAPPSPVCESAAGTVPCATAAPSTLAPSVLPSPAAPEAAFRCTGPLGNDLAYTYYRSCDPVPWESVPVPVLPTTVPSTPSFATTAPVATTEPPRAGEQSYIVVEGDTLTAIAERYGIDLAVIASYNAWPEGIDRLLLVGDVVKIPPGSRIP